MSDNYQEKIRQRNKKWGLTYIAAAGALMLLFGTIGGAPGIIAVVVAFVAIAIWG